MDAPLNRLPIYQTGILMYPITRELFVFFSVRTVAVSVRILSVAACTFTHIYTSSIMDCISLFLLYPLCLHL